MKNSLILTLTALSLSAAAFAQSPANPAETAYLNSGFIRIGEFQSVSRNNVGAASFLFPKDGKLVTGLHSSISADDFLEGLPDVSSVYNQYNYNLFSYGWKGSGPGIHTLELGAKADYGLTVPDDIFRILKTGTSQSPYDLASLRAFGNLYGELAYGYSVKLGERFSLGTRIKLLVGLNSVDISARHLSLTTAIDRYSIDFDTDIDLTSRSKKVGIDEDGLLDYADFTGKGKLGAPTGAGLAADFGVLWKPFRGLTLSASVQDLGFLCWYYGNAGNSSGVYSFEGLKNLTLDELDGEKIKQKALNLGKEVLAVIRPRAAEGVFKVKSVPLTATASANYALPFWEGLSIGASGLYTGHSYCAPYWEARGGIALDFPDRFHIGATAGSGAYGFVYGVNGSVDILSFRLYAGYENGIGGTIPYSGTHLKANSNRLLVGLVYLL